MNLTQGPNDPEKLATFSLDAVISELNTYAPDLYSLFLQLGRTTPSDIGDCRSSKEIRVTSSICSLMGARSRKSNGIQLLLGPMLIARSTSRQVNAWMEKIIHNTNTFLHNTNIIFTSGHQCPQPCWCLYIVLYILELSPPTHSGI